MDVATIVSVAGGAVGIITAIFVIAERVKKVMTGEITAKIADTEKRICKDITEFKGDIVEMKSDIKECRDDSKETLQKLNEHLITAGQAMAEFEHLKGRVNVHADELEDLQKAKTV